MDIGNRIIAVALTVPDRLVRVSLIPLRRGVIPTRIRLPMTIASCTSQAD
jgi:hypothetical protein